MGVVHDGDFMCTDHSSPDDEEDAGSVLTEDEEDEEDYCQGGYHPMNVCDEC